MAPAWIALAWWSITLAVVVLSSLASLVFPWPRRLPATWTAQPVTAVVPVKHLDAGFDQAQASLFDQDYPGLEILIASAEAQSEAASAAQAIASKRPAVRSRLVVSTPRPAASPKLANLWAAIEQAPSDLILIKDSNVRLEPGQLARLVRFLQPGVGVVCSLTVLTGPRSPAAWIEASILDGHHVRILMLARAFGFGFGLGKVTLFRRSDLERAGGLASLAWALGEDEALTSALARLGLRTVIADTLAIHELGERSWAEVWNRMLRWKVIWRVQAPAVFVGSLAGSALLAAIAGAIAAPLLGMAPAVVAAASLAAWCGLELLVCAVRGWPVSAASPFVFLMREIFELMVWLRALTTSEVDWAGVRYRSESALAGRP